MYTADNKSILVHKHLDNTAQTNGKWDISNHCYFRNNFSARLSVLLHMFVTTLDADWNQHFYAALLPRRNASHSVCPSVCPSVPLSLRHVAPPSELQWHTCTFRHAQRAAYRTAISAAQACWMRVDGVLWCHDVFVCGACAYSIQYTYNLYCSFFLIRGHLYYTN